MTPHSQPPSLRAFTRELPSRLLYVSHAPPVPARLGPARRHYHVLDQLARFYDVHFLSLGDRADADAFARTFAPRVRDFTFVPRQAGWATTRIWKTGRTLAGRCDFLPVLEPGLRRACQRLTDARAFDAIVLSSVLLRGLPLPANVPVIGDTHNVEFDVLRRTASGADGFWRRHYAGRQWPATRTEEGRCGRGVDLLLATSERDRRLFEEELDLRSVAVVPNGIDFSEFTPARARPEPRTLLFSGLMSYYPNQQAMRWFLGEVWPRVQSRVPGLRLIVAGAAPPRWLRAVGGGAIEVTGRVPDIRPYIERSSVVIAPLMIGGGTRVKILEALAVGRPVVSTTVGAEGLGLRDGESVMIGDEPQAFADAVAALLEDDRLAARVALHGLQHVADHFDWDRIGERAAALFGARLGLHARVASSEVRGEAVGS